MKFNADPIQDYFSRLIPLPARFIAADKTRKQFRRARALAAMLVTTTLTTFFWILVSPYLHFVSGKQLRPMLDVSFVVLMILAGQTLFFYRFANVRLSAVFMTMSYFLILIVIVICTGGYDSPLKVLLLSSPIISFRIGGKEEGTMNTLLVALLGAGLIYAKYSGIYFVNIFPTVGEYFLATVAWLVTLTATVTCLMVYDVDE